MTALTTYEMQHACQYRTWSLEPAVRTVVAASVVGSRVAAVVVGAVSAHVAMNERKISIDHNPLGTVTCPSSPHL